MKHTAEKGFPFAGRIAYVSKFAGSTLFHADGFSPYVPCIQAPCQNAPFQDAKDRKRTLLYGLLYTLSVGLSSFINPATLILCLKAGFHTTEPVKFCRKPVLS